ncbi:hypothetical protein [Thorsellia kenyensis]|uniref:Uncharacterized protein n=1 Tax=Thorsellia kenyensis TaxID=1549888 RepID=A0ABV6CBY4_9GAMM
MKSKLIIGGLFLALSGSVLANDACTNFFDEMDKFYETLNKEGISPDQTAQYRNDVATSRMQHNSFSESDKEINNKYCQEQLADIESVQSLIRMAFESQ